MAKEMALWDDSALINAFNAAMTKYQDMHKNPRKHIGSEDGKVESDKHDGERNEVEAATGNTSSEERNEETAGACSIGLCTSLPASGAAGQAAHSQQECSVGQAHCSGPYGVDHTCPSMQTNSGDSLNAQNIEYSRLINNYHDLEKQRQEVLQQLYQINGWNGQATNEQPTSNAPWGGFGYSHGAQDGSYYPQHPPIQPYCYPYPYYWPTQPPVCMAPCSQYVPSSSSCACASNKFQGPDSERCYKNASHPTSLKTTVEPAMPSVTTDGITETVMKAVKKATSTVRADISGTADVSESEVKIDSSGEGSSNTDIAEMLHAWFSAGFYTARCLSAKESMGKKQ